MNKIRACPIIPKEQIRISNPKTIKPKLGFYGNYWLCQCPCGIIFKIDDYPCNKRIIKDLVAWDKKINKKESK